MFLVLGVGLLLVLAGCSGQAVPAQEPVAAFRLTPSSPQTGTPASFDASDSADPDGSISSYEWDFDGDGTIDESTDQPTVDHAYRLTGSYTVILTVTDDAGLSDSTSALVDVTGNDYPIAELTHSPENPTTSDKVILNAGGSTDRDGSISSYRWDIDGDGTYDTPWSIDSDRETGYGSPGTYEPSVQVEDNEGATDTATTTVNVQ